MSPVMLNNTVEIILIPAFDLARDVAAILAVVDPFASVRARITFCNGIDVSHTMSTDQVGSLLKCEDMARKLAAWCMIGTDHDMSSVDDGWVL
jgi:hypothetical protein